MSREALPGAVPGESEERPAAKQAKPAPRSRAGAGRPKPSLGGGRPAQDRELRAQGRQTVRRLLEAGLAEFDERGYQAVRVDDIVRRARTSHGTFYLYFANKDDLFKALLRDALHDMGVITDAFPVVTRNEAGRTALRQWVHTFCETYAAHAAVIRILSQADLVGEEVWGDGLQLLFRLAEAITQGMTAASPLWHTGQAGGADGQAGGGGGAAGGRAAGVQGRDRGERGERRDDESGAGAGDAVLAAAPAGHAELTAVACLMMLERVNYLLSVEVRLPRDEMVDRITAIIFAAFHSP
ncbi:MAG TPA: helix-turn-helix domain-containing protein [Streptosporangiaceae bacterium]|nr:helix-turn-helix domain-containing protein [Streptosporangiaceae bacterium]